MTSHGCTKIQGKWRNTNGSSSALPRPSVMQRTHAFLSFCDRSHGWLAATTSAAPAVPAPARARAGRKLRGDVLSTRRTRARADWGCRFSCSCPWPRLRNTLPISGRVTGRSPPRQQVTPPRQPVKVSPRQPVIAPHPHPLQAPPGRARCRRAARSSSSPRCLRGRTEGCGSRAPQGPPSQTARLMLP